MELSQLGTGTTIILIIICCASLSGIIRVFISKDASNIIGVIIPWLWFFICYFGFPFVFASIKGANSILSSIVFFLCFIIFFYGTIVLFFFSYVVIYFEGFSYKKELPKLIAKMFGKSKK